MKTKDWIAHPRSKSKKELGDQVTGRWKVNIFFLLLVSSQSLIIPWLPAVLLDSGLQGVGIGVVMALITFASVLSVKIVLVFITATKSGALRRFTLLFLLGTASVMYVCAIAALPFDKSYNSCSSDPVPSGEMSSSNATPPTFLPASSPTPALVVNSSASLPNTPKVPSGVESGKNTTILTTPLTTTTSTPRTTTTSTTTSAKPSATSDIHSVDSSTTSSSTDKFTNDWSSFVLNKTDSTLSGTGIPTDSQSDVGFDHPSGSEESNLLPIKPTGQKESISSLGNKPSNNAGNLASFNWNSFLSGVTGLGQQPSGGLGRSEHEKEISGLSSIRSDFYDNYPLFQNHGPSYQQHEIQKEHLRPSYYDSFGKNPLFNDKHSIVKRHYRKKEKDNEQNVQLSFNHKIDLEQKLHEELNNGESFDLDSANIEKLKEILGEVETKTESIELPTPTKESGPWIWVSILLVSASLMFGGIEAGVTRLWHCYNHCYHLFHNRPRQDVNSDDLLERTLTDTFELSANGEHHGWSRILSGCVIIVSSVLLAFGCQLGLPPGWSLVGQAGVFTVGAAFTVTVLLLLLPVPWGSIKPPKMARPLSLYLDDEVLWEGLRRIACPLGTAVHGLLSSLPSVYVVLLLSSRTEDAKFGSALSVLGVSFSLLGEGFTGCCRRKLTSVLDSPGLVGLSLGSLAVQLMLVYFVEQETAQWLVAASWAVVGAGHALTVMSVRQNALMLATIRDQEREAWVSWVSGRMGTAVGSFLWPFIALLKWGSVAHLQKLLMPLAATAAVLAVSVAALAALTRSRRAARRRVYHTLDLHSTADADDEDSDEEEDWLVRGARKEGMSL